MCWGFKALGVKHKYSEPAYIFEVNLLILATGSLMLNHFPGFSPGGDGCGFVLKKKRIWRD